MRLDEFEHCMVKAGDVNIHAVIGGKGSPLVLLHGFPQTWWEWRKMMPILAEHHTVVAIDMRGAGQSDCPQGGYDKAQLAADAHAVMAALGYPKYAVCGHDIGGMVGLAQAALFRDAVTHFAILDVPVPGWSRWLEIFSDPRVWHFAFHMKANLPERLLYNREYDYVSTFIFDRAYDHGAHDVADVKVFADAFAQPGRTRGGLEWYRAFPKDHADALEWKKDPLPMPVLALGGDLRWGPEIVGMMKEFASNVTGGGIAKCNHWLPEERPLETSEALLAFLANS